MSGPATSESGGNYVERATVVAAGTLLELNDLPGILQEIASVMEAIGRGITDASVQAGIRAMREESPASGGAVRAAPALLSLLGTELQIATHGNVVKPRDVRKSGVTQMSADGAKQPFQRGMVSTRFEIVSSVTSRFVRKKAAGRAETGG